jgi:hypothetical protein
MSSADPQHQRLVEARARATVARLRFISSAQSTRRRLSLGRLKEDAREAATDRLDEAKRDLRQTVRRHPVLVLSAVAGAAAIIFWKPARLVALYGIRGAELVWFNRKLWRSNDDK